MRWTPWLGAERGTNLPSDDPTLLVTGASGFVGRHLAERLGQEHRQVILTSRDPDRVDQGPGEIWRRCDLDDPITLKSTFEGIDVAYYLVHGMGSKQHDYAAREQKWATDFARVASDAGVKRIVYLGGIEPPKKASAHLESRLATGRILRSGTVPTVELRAGMIVGQGSESWRIVRDLSVRLPAMLLPRWLANRMEPIGIDDVITALVRAADADVDPGVYGLPGPEALTGEQILRRVSGIDGTRPVCISVPFVTPRLSSYWIRLVTRADPQIATELVQGMSTDLISHEAPFWPYLPDHQLERFDAMAERGLRGERSSLSMSAKFTENLLRRVSRLRN